jgi:two-component system KDP operon response regulator KdpE
VILSGRGQERDIVRALDLGADDYLTKPFGIAELMARVRVALRHNPSGSDSSRTPLTIHDMTIDFWENKVFLRGNEIELTRLEFDLLAYLALNAGRTITHRALLQNVWGPEYGDETEYLWTYIKRLQHKIEQDPHNPHLILTHAGFGYSLASPS